MYKNWRMIPKSIVINQLLITHLYEIDSYLNLKTAWVEIPEFVLKLIKTTP